MLQKQKKKSKKNKGQKAMSAQLNGIFLLTQHNTRG